MRISRREFVSSSTIGISTLMLSRQLFGDELRAPAYKNNLRAANHLFDGRRCWVHPRAGIVPGAGRDRVPRVIITMNSHDLAGNDVFKAMYELCTNDLGKTWSEPRECA
jgi:hypothetical protein